MNRQDRGTAVYKIDRKWVKENERRFSEFPGLPRSGVPGEEESWLALMEFYRDDLKWLLSLAHHKFWSYMIYSDKAHGLLISYLQKYPPYYIKNYILVQEDMKNIFADVEHLVFLIFLRLSTEKESESCYVWNFGDVIYNNYLFTVPVILDICLIYGTSNHDLVKKMINNVITSAPDFLDDFQEIIPHFVKVLKTVKEKFSLGRGPVSECTRDLKSNEIQDLILYLCDSVATIQIFFDFYPNICQLFNKTEVVHEIVCFYSSVLPEMISYCSTECGSLNKKINVFNLIENIRIDLLKIVKSILDYFFSETYEIDEKKNEVINEYLTLMMELLSEPLYLFDYNLLYSVEFEIEHAVKDSKNVDLVKVNCILEGVARAIRMGEGNIKESFTSLKTDETKVKLDSLITEVKDIFPHLEEHFIRKCLNYHNNNTEKVIAAVLENLIPPDLKNPNKNDKSEIISVFKGTHKYIHKNLNEMLNDREEVSKLKEKCMQLSLTGNDIYNDEYDDTYDDNTDVIVRDGDETNQRPFVVPRVLQTEETEEEEEEENDEDEKNMVKGNFIENPSADREQKKQIRLHRDVIGRGRGHGQSKQVLRNREFKEFHKSTVANHNRKKQAGRKFSRGMIPS